MPDDRIERPQLARFLFAVSMTVAGLAASVLLLEVSDAPIYAPLTGAVALSVWFGGLRPGIAALFLGWAAALWLLVEPRGELGFDTADDMTRWWVNLAVAGIIVVVAGVLRERELGATRAAAEADASMRRVAAFQGLTAALAASVSSADVADVLAGQAAPLVRADGAAVWIVDGEELSREASMGVADAVRPTARRLPLDRNGLITQAARDGVVVRADRRSVLEESFAETSTLLPGLQGAIVVPLRASGQVVGALEFLFLRPGAVNDEVVTVAATVAAVAEQALERARLYERERESRQALDRILRVAPSFHADTPAQVIEAICREARTTFGSDYGVLWRTRGDRLELVHIEPPQETLAAGGEWPLEDFPGLATAVRTLDVAFVPDVLEEAVGEGLELVSGLGIRSSLRTPIVLGGRTELVLAVSWQVVVPEPEPSTIAVVRRFADQAGLALEEVERRRAQADAARRTDEAHRLQEITAALSLASTPLDVSNTCLEHALRSVGTDAGFVVLSGPGGTSVEVVASDGLDEDELGMWGAFAPDADVPFARALAGGDAIWALTAEEMAAFTGVTSPDAGWVAIPLRTAAGTRGVLQLLFREPTRIDESERQWLKTAVSQCAQALERSRLFEQEQLLRSRAERGQNMTAALSNALTRTDVANVVVQDVGAALDADGAVLFVVDSERNTLRALAWQGFADELFSDASELPLESRAPRNRAVSNRRSTFYGSAEELERDLPDLDVAEPWLADAASTLFLPLVAGRRSNGLVTVVWNEPRALPDDERRYVESLAGQAAQALDRASHFESERTIAETLQRSVLPVSLPRVDGVQLAARYLPGTAELAVGGDWFDAMKLPDGKLGLVVGDVVGKGVYAAASMGQLRNALRAFSVDRIKPSSALARLNRLAEEVLETTFATIVYIVLDPETRVCRYASAGHPPAVVVYPDDRVELLEGGRGLPLGTGPDVKYRQAVVELPAGSVLLLYSDGLVERRGHSIDEGLDDLCQAVREAPREPERLLEHVLERMVGDEARGDDVVLLAVRVLTVAPQPLDLCISSRTGSLELVRDALRVWLDSAGVARDEAEDILLAAWEACANAVEHADEPSGDLVHVSAVLDDSSVRIVVEDSGRWTPFAERPGRGLGLRLMESLMTDVEVEKSEDGTRVTVEKRIAGADDSDVAPSGSPS